MQFARLRSVYRWLFSIEEIESNTTLQWLFGVLLLFFFVTFYQWSSSTVLSLAHATRNVCWPHFPSCDALLFFSSSPYSYSQNIFYTLLFAAMIALVYCAWRRWWTAAHAMLLALFLWKFVAVFFLSYGIGGVYDYYHLIITAVFLFVPHKEYFAKLAFVLLYFLSATVKFYPSWILGTYFSSLALGLPLFPDALVLPISMSVIVSQVFGAWFLLSRRPLYQRMALIYFGTFHLYSTIFVGFNYPSFAESTLLVLFGPLYRYQAPPISRRAIAGWLMMALLFAFQAPAYLIPGDEKLTMEGYRFGMWMFDSNHQCVAEFTMYYREARPDFRTSEMRDRPGTPCEGSRCVTARSLREIEGQWVGTIRIESPKAEVRCSPYTYWQRYRYLCEGAERVAFTFDHSVNGGAFFRIVEVPDMCALTYSAFGRNQWIKEPPEARAIGFPVENIYY
ncbi:MAG TPA: hypothetical protein VJB97_01690 [Candidatus Paceibacterota bacterium]